MLAAELPMGATAGSPLRTAAQESTAPKFVSIRSDAGPAIGGLCVDILRAIERVDREIRFVGDQQWTPLTRVEAELASGALDVAPCLVKSPPREAQFVFIEPALFKVSFSLAVRADDEVQVKNWDDVRRLGPDSTVLAVKSVGATERARQTSPGIGFDTDAATPELNLRKLLAGRGRFFYHATAGLRQEIARTGLTGKVKMLSPPMDTTSSYLAVSKNLPQDMAERLSRAIRQLQASGELQTLARKWQGQ